MTEAEWLNEADPEKLLAHLMGRRPSERKLRLFAAACSRRHPRASRKAATVAERHADGLATARDLAEAYPQSPGGRSYWAVAEPRAADAALYFVPGWMIPYDQPLKAALLRDLFGNPFRPRRLRPDPTWPMPLVASLATAAYRKRRGRYLDLDPVRLAVLADALEEAGCADEAILSHLRSAGPHVRGCWAVDCVLGKEWSLYPTWFPVAGGP
jgi:hypothetical protein